MTIPLLRDTLALRAMCALCAVLQALYPGGAAELDEALAALCRRHYVARTERLVNDTRYAFHSTAVAEVIYSLMLTAQRERLHTQIGELYERACARRVSNGLSVEVRARLGNRAMRRRRTTTTQCIHRRPHANTQPTTAVHRLHADAITTTAVHRPRARPLRAPRCSASSRTTLAAAATRPRRRATSSPRATRR